MHSVFMPAATIIVDVHTDSRVHCVSGSMRIFLCFVESLFPFDTEDFRSSFSVLSAPPPHPPLCCCDALSALFLSPLSNCLREAEGHRKITIIIEDPVAGWQRSSTVLHF